MAKELPERGKSKGANATARKAATPPNPRRQKLWRDLSLIAIAPLLLYLLACLFTYSPNDPGWSQAAGSVLTPIHNIGGAIGAWIADFLRQMFGYTAYVLPLQLGAIAWIALFGMDTDGDGEADLGPALRLVGMVGFLIAALGVGWVSITLRKYGRIMHYVEIAMGVVLVILGFMLFTGIFERIAQAGQFFWVDFGL